jgi:hypothetical protein
MASYALAAEQSDWGALMPHCDVGGAAVLKNPGGLLRFNVVQKALGISAAGTFKNDVRRHADFIEALDNHGITEAWRIGDNRRGFLRPRFVEGLF